MDVQLKKGLLDACVLASISRGDSYGYILLRDISPVVEISESTLYPILRRLEKAGFLVVYSREQAGRLRKYYSITDIGRKKLDELRSDFESLNRVYEFISERERES